MRYILRMSTIIVIITLSKVITKGEYESNNKKHI